MNIEPHTSYLADETRQWGLAYSQDQDLGRVPMDMRKPPSPIETYKMTLSSTEASSGKLAFEFENVMASVPVTVK